MNYSVLSALLNDKKGRHAYLRSRLEQLEEQYVDLLSNIGGKTLTNIGSVLRGTLFLIVALVMLVFGAISVIQAEQVIQEIPLLENSELMAKKKLLEYDELIELDEISRQALITKTKQDIDKNRQLWLRISAALMILLSFYMFSKRKQAKRLREVRKQIIEANKATLDIIDEFENIIKEEEQEIMKLEALVG